MARMDVTRAALTAVLAFSLGPRTSVAQRPEPTRPDTVLFVCEHGTVKSVIAKLYFEQFATERGLPVVALSRGTKVEPAVPAWLAANLARDHFALADFQPHALVPADLANKRIVISFDVPASATAATAAPRERWDGLPAVSENYVSGRDAIRERVRALVDSLARASQRPPD